MDPVDAGIDQPASFPQMAIDTSDWVYIAFVQVENALGISRIYLSRYGAPNNLMEIWGNNLPAGPPIDNGNNANEFSPQLLTDAAQ